MIQFDSTRSTVVLFDGECSGCNKFVVFVLYNDPHSEIFLSSLNSGFGARLLGEYGLGSVNKDTIVLIQKGKAYLRSTAVLKIYGMLRFPYSLAKIFLVVPAFIRDWVYVRVARNRHTIFGRSNECALIPKELRERLLT